MLDKVVGAIDPVYFVWSCASLNTNIYFVSFLSRYTHIGLNMTITEDPTSLTVEDLPELLKNDNSVKVAGCDIDGMMRGKLMSKKKFLSVAESGFGFCSVVFGWDMHDQTYFRELKISNKENGYRDLLAQIDLSSYRRIPWEDNVPFFLVSFREPTGESLSACPRSVLERASKKLEDQGLGALAGGE